MTPPLKIESLAIQRTGREIAAAGSMKSRFDRWTGETTNPRVYKPLAIAVARAHRWKDLLANGIFPTMNDLADRLELDRAYVRRLMNLTLLAPDLVEAILRGDEPSGLSLAGGNGGDPAAVMSTLA